MRLIDERDTTFSRMALVEGSDRYRECYARRPELEARDREVRNAPMKGILSRMRPDACFDGLPDRQAALEHIVDGNVAMIFASTEMIEKAPISARRIAIPPEEITPVIKEVALYFGADIVGIVEMQDEHFYTHHGHSMGGKYGEPVDKSLRYAIVLAVEMDRDMINRAPHLEEILATDRGYRDVALAGCGAAIHLKSLGYRAFLNTVATYNAPLVRLARDAGLGQIGRHGMLITKKHGSRVRLGAVMTDMPLLPDGRIDFGLEKFCMRCGNCARNCIGGAISEGQPVDEDGQLRWTYEDTNCMEVWKRVGTDCGICIASCPFSHNIEEDLIDSIKDDPMVIEKIIRDFRLRFGRRPVNKDKLKIAQL
ncbi:MAG TPA: reductive dehalogenase domain-containing protein [bacterium]|nr:reductive dehalogenase domain-containing protein [bacterium]